MASNSPSEPPGSLSTEARSPVQIVKTEDYLHLPSNSRLARSEPNNNRPTTGSAVFLDRDGVLVEEVHYLREPGQLKILPGVVSGIRTLASRFYIIVVTNQSGVARDLLTEEDLLGIHTELVRRLSGQGAVIDALYYCPHLPDAPVRAYSVPCDCRKPAPGMMLRAATDWGLDLARSFLVGDMPRDIQSGRAAGVKTIKVGTGSNETSGADWVAGDMVEAARLILAKISNDDGASPAQAVSLPSPGLRE